ncbi:putative helicase with zinc finger domain [Orchesella cincta]|uniref:Putative helicase with zinc finger domain n=1 Tax=Orchesella cincta TaxID=48709 RepID=A0A1D2MGF2_ORCCI|nr:putative helicase with zinc finger domain [Orchesella cincta]
MMSDISYDSKLRKVINDSCSTVLISGTTDINSAFRKTLRRYLCNIVDKSKSAIIIAIGRRAVGELVLLSDSIRPLQVQFVLDSSKIDRMKFTLEDFSEHHLELLFPGFESSKSPPFVKIMDPIGLLNEEELTLNSRQMSVYNLLTERKVLIDVDAFTPPVLVTGPVSTGKTYLLAHCLRALLRSYPGVPPNRILVCTQSDLAADVYITEYLHRWLVNDELSVQRSKPLRIYGADRFVDTVGGAVKHYCLFNNDGTSFRYPSKDEVLSHKVIIITLSTCAELIQIGLDDDTFTHIIIDESALSLEAECVQPIVFAGSNTKIVIAGDIRQTNLGMFAMSKGVPPLSLLERLRNMYPFRHPFAVNLIDNYTNHEVIVKFISEMFYHDQMRPASNQPCHPSYYPLTFHHIPSSRELQPDNGGGYYNMEEIRCVVDFIEEVLRSWPETWGKPDATDNLVVVTPYTNHVIGLRVQLQLKSLPSVNVELISNVLGSYRKRFRVVIISTVRTYKNYSENLLANPSDSGIDGGFFSDRRLINTALSCAKSLVVVFGDALSLWSHGICRDVWRQYLNECHKHKSLRGFPQLGDKSEESAPKVSIAPTQEKILSPPSCLTADSKVIRHPPPPPPPLLDSRAVGHKVHVDNGLVTRGGLKTSVNPLSNNFENSSSWNFNGSSLHEAPKTDLFSAFSSNSETLYASSSKLDVSAGTESVESANSSFNKINSNIGIVNTSVYKPLEGYRSPFQLPSVTHVSSTMEDLKDVGNVRNTEGMIVENNLSPIIPQPMPLPTPTIPSHVLYNRNFFLEGGSSPAVANIVEANQSFGLGNFQSSPQKFISPLLRGPPGFTSVAYEPKLGMFSSDNSATRSTSPYRGGGAGGGLATKYGYKRNTYELPPRMLKNLSLGNHRSTTPRKLTSNLLPAEMNFFEELGLDSQSAKETSRSGSSSSSDNSIIDSEEAIGVVDEEYSNLSPQSDWIEVKSTRKGKHQSTRKSRGKDKHLPGSEEALETTSEMSVDDKVELITQMGFSKTQAIKALQACDKDLQRAVDWLISKPTSNKSSS